MSTLVQDVRYGIRMLAKNPGFTAVAVLTLALGIGANTAIFTLIDAVMLKALPVQKPEQLALFSEGRRRGFVGLASGQHYDIFSYPLYEHLRDNNPSFEGIAAFRTELDRLTVRPQGGGENEPAQLAWGRLVSGNYFSVLGVRAVLGRVLTPEDDRVEGPPAAVISYDYWRHRFNNDPSVVGRVLNVNGILLTVAGVTPPEFFGESVESPVADFWLPVTLAPRLMPERGSLLKNLYTNWLNLIGRLKPGVSLQQAQAGVDVSFRQFLSARAGAHPSAEEQRDIQRSYIKLTPGATGISYLRFLYSRPLHILMAVVALVLLIACANVANILLSRAAARQREISLRLAVGASRSRLLRQLLTESVLLGLLGGAVAVLLSAWGVDILVRMVAGGTSRLPLNVTPDATVLGFTLAVSLLTGILFGLTPAFRATGTDVAQSLKSGTLGTSPGARWNLSKTLVVSQVALSLLLLVCAGLLVRTLDNLSKQDLGFNPQHVLEVGIDPRISGYKQDQLNPLYQALLERVDALPGVRVASLSLYSPMSGNGWGGQISVQGYFPPPNEQADCQWVWVGPHYAETEGMTLLLGRDLGPGDTKGAPQVAVVNEIFAQRYLAKQNPIGRRFSMGTPAKTYEIEIVGVVKNFRFDDPWEENGPVAFLPLAQVEGPASYAANLEIRTTADPTSIAGSVRRAIQALDKNLPVTGISALSEQVNESLHKERLIARLSSFFGVLALLLACIGLYGLLAYRVARRTNEIGIRMALGADRRRVLWMVLGESLALVGVGAAIGLALAFAATRFISSLLQLYGVKPTDPATIAAATMALVAVAVFAGYIPARRATKVDPTVALRYE
jgi:predicted permease